MHTGGGSASREASAAESRPEITHEEAAGMMEQARALYEQGRYRRALMRCVDISYTAPETPGLRTLRAEVLEALQAQREKELDAQQEATTRALAQDARERWDLPGTYGMRRFVDRDEVENLEEDYPLLKQLNKPVTIHLKNASLNQFMRVISEDRNLNVIADQNLSVKGGLDVEVSNTPLSEVLDYIARNFGVEFYFGKNILWITKPNPKDGPMFQTRIFKLQRGLLLHASDWKGTEKGKEDQIAGLSSLSTVLPDGETSVEKVIKQFVPQPKGAALLLDRDAHSLVVKNTPVNLKKTEEIIRTLDTYPPQILIEARFIETTLSDLSELGVEWILNDDFSTFHSDQVIVGGGPNDPLVSFDRFTGQDELSPVDVFNDSDQSFSLADQGLNMTYQGILNNAQFQAVLHALDISGKGRTLSVPRVTTLNNTPAKLRNGQDFRFYDEFKAQAFALVDANNRKYTVTALMPSGAPKMEELGITLVAVPSVGADLRTINLLLQPTIAQFEGFESYQSTNVVAGAQQVQQIEVKLPKFSRKEVQTRVVVESGETVVMGGLIDVVEKDTENKVPLLGDLPYIGKAFRQEHTSEQTRNLLIFVTATVLSERGESLLPANRLSRSSINRPAAGEQAAPREPRAAAAPVTEDQAVVKETPAEESAPAKKPDEKSAPEKDKADEKKPAPKAEGKSG
ncbi:type II secretion system protein GspD [Kiritimatiella glycovorans]|nr:hypothetical protein [Kiritimatiella glycovorans]